MKRVTIKFLLSPVVLVIIIIIMAVIIGHFIWFNKNILYNSLLIEKSHIYLVSIDSIYTVQIVFTK